MKKPLRISLIVLPIVLGMIMLLAILLPLVIDPNNYRDTITQQVEQKTGRILTLGNIELSIFPWLGVQLSDVKLSNASGFKPAQMVLLKNLNLHVKLLPLFKGEFQVGEVTLDNLSVSLARNKKGITNWDDILHKLQQDTATTSNKEKDNKPRPSGETKKDANTLPVFAIDGIHIVNAKLDWHDAQKRTAYQIKQLKLDLGALQTQKFVPLVSSFKFTSDQPKANGTIQLSTAVDINPVTQTFRLRDIKVREIIHSKLIPGGMLDVTTQAKAINLFMKKQLLEITALEARTFNVHLNSTARITSLLENPAYEASVKLTKFSPRELMRALKIDLPPSADPKVLTQLTLNAQIKGNTKSLKIKPLSLKLDETSIKGDIALQLKQQPLFTFNLDADQIDVDRYLSPAKTEKKPSSKQENIPTPKQEKIPTAKMKTPTKTARVKSPAHALAGLTKLDLDGMLRIQKFKVNQLHLQQLRVPIKNNKGIMKLNPVQAKLYQGTSHSDITIVANEQQPRFALKQQLSKIQLAPLLQDLISDDKASGMANVTANFTTKGLSVDTIKTNLNGTTNFDLKDGEVKGINIPEMKRKINAALKRQAAPEASDNATAFSDARGSAMIKNGIISNNDLRATLSHARIAGLGLVSLPSNIIDYTLLVKFTSEATAQTGTKYDEMDKVALPIHIRGALNDPSIKPNYEAVLKELADRELKKQEKLLKKRLEDEVNKKLSDELEKIFKKK